MTTRNKYSDEDKATALAMLDANNGTIVRTAKQTKIAPSTLTGWAKNRGVHPQVTKLREVKKGELAEKLEQLAHVLVDGLIDGRHHTERTGIKDVATALGIAVDKLLLLRGAPNALPETRPPMTEAQKEARIAELLQKGMAPLILPHDSHTERET